MVYGVVIVFLQGIDPSMLKSSAQKAPTAPEGSGVGEGAKKLHSAALATMPLAQV